MWPAATIHRIELTQHHRMRREGTPPQLGAVRRGLGYLLGQAIKNSELDTAVAASLTPMTASILATTGTATSD